MKNSSLDSNTCEDIAHQLVYGETGKKLNVILGGGRAKFLPHFVVDEEGDFGDRLDGVNLINKWMEQKKGKGRYVYDRDGLLRETSNADYVLGLFESSHMQYNLDADKQTEPTLAEMTEAAIKNLRRSRNGFFLFVEGGRIDMAHHSTLAQKSLDETVQFSEAIQRAVNMTNAKDTLIVVTSDHSHTMSFSGYPTRDNNIFGSAGTGTDQIAYASLSYANGPSYRVNEDGSRPNFLNDNTRKFTKKFYIDL